MTIHGSQHSDDREKQPRFPWKFRVTKPMRRMTSANTARGVFVIHFAMLNVHSDTLARVETPLDPRSFAPLTFSPKNHFMISIKPTIKR
jgi:hypothetical protein